MFSYRANASEHGTVDSEASRIHALCQQCVNYTDLGMLDSASACIQRARALNLYPSLKVLLELQSLRLDDFVNESDSAYLHLENALELMEHHKIDFCISTQVYESAFSLLAYMVRCKEGLPLAERYLRLSRETKETEHELRALAMLTQLKMYVEDREPDAVLEAEMAEISAQYPELKALHQELLGNRFYYFADYPKAAEKYLRAMALYNELGQTSEWVRMNLEVGSLFAELMNFSKSIEYYERCIPYYAGEGQTQSGEFYNTIGWSFFRLNELEKALSYFQKARTSYATHAPSNPDIAYPIGNLGLVYRKQGELDSALQYSEAASELFRRINNYGGMAESCNNIGHVYLELGNVDMARIGFEKALEKAEQAHDSFEQMNAYEGLYTVFKENDPATALYHLERHLELKSQFQLEEEAAAMQQVETEQLLHMNEDIIHELEVEAKFNSLEIERSNLRINLISIAFLLSSALALMLAAFWMNRQRLLKKLEASNANNQKVIRMISHDFRGPVNNIQSMLELLHNREIDTSEFQELTKILYQQSSSVALLFDSFVGWAAEQSGGYKPTYTSFDWASLVDEVVDLHTPMAKMKGIELVVRSKESIEVTSDHRAASLILRNLIANALKFSPDGSKVCIEYTCCSENNKLNCVVKDKGIGIDDKYLSRLFDDQYAQTDESGERLSTGMGLKMSYQYARALKGNMSVISSPGSGSKFTVTLPLSEARQSV